MAKCMHYCNGYCFFHGDTGHVCDCISISGKKRDGYCPMREQDDELERIARGMIQDDQYKTVMEILVVDATNAQKARAILDFFNQETVTTIKIKRESRC